MDWRNSFGTSAVLKELALLDSQVHTIMLTREYHLRWQMSPGDLSSLLTNLRQDTRVVDAFSTQVGAALWAQLSDDVLLRVMYTLQAQRLTQDNLEQWTVIPHATRNALMSEVYIYQRPSASVDMGDGLTAQV